MATSAARLSKPAGVCIHRDYLCRASSQSLHFSGDCGTDSFLPSLFLSPPVSFFFVFFVQARRSAAEKMAGPAIARSVSLQCARPVAHQFFQQRSDRQATGNDPIITDLTSRQLIIVRPLLIFIFSQSPISPIIGREIAT